MGHRVALWAVEAGHQRFGVELGPPGPAVGVGGEHGGLAVRAGEFEESTHRTAKSIPTA
ncbi:hypothetical protein Ais01nite_39350 [Asanoa ishikariensis]|nr:hypothetical protein Ais01nite_39350 [Asanoa ishikariensis]